VRTRAIAPGDLVLVNKRGRLFHARVLGTGARGGLNLEPLDRRITWRQATAREVIDHWTHARRDPSDRPDSAQLAFEDMNDR
jgi:hypothetical protein